MNDRLFHSAFVALFIANCSVVVSFTSFFLYPIQLINIGGSELDIGLIMGCFAGASALCRPWISEMIDRIGRWRSYLIGCCGMALFPLFYLLLPADISAAYPYLIPLRVLHGIALAIAFTAAFTFIADIVPSHRMNEGIGIFGISGLLATGIGPGVGEIVIGRFGFPALYIFASLAALIAVCCHHWLEETSSHQDTISAPVPFFTILKRKKMMRIFCLSLLFGTGIAAYANFIAPLAKERGILSLTPYYMVYAIAAISTRFGGGRLSDRIGEGRVVAPSMVITGSGFLLLVWADSTGALIAAGALSGIGHGLLFPTLNTLALRGTPSTERGKVTGIFTGSIDMGAFVGAYLLGAIGEMVGLAAIFFVAFAGLAGGAFSAYNWFYQKKEQTEVP